MTSDLPTSVQMQFMRPGQLEAAAKAFPVVYVPLGLIEWHGRHLPLGNDAIKAHAFAVKAAEQFGGVVYPPLYFPSAQWADGKINEADMQSKVPMLTALFQQLKATGFRVIIGISGHNIIEQVQMVDAALKPVTADGTIAGAGMYEFVPGLSPDSASDHAAKWETSNMMYFYPNLVDMAELGDGPLAPNMQPPDGIGGEDPRKHASAEVGRRNVEIASAAIGKKARELLESLPPEHRAFRLPAIRPGIWWMV